MDLVVEPMDPRLLFLVAIGVGAPVVGIPYRRFRARKLADVSDTEFLRRFAQHHSAPADAVLSQRRRVGRMLGIPREKLTPEQTLEELSKRFGYIAEFSVAWSDLDDEVCELRRSAGADEHAAMPSTVGELVAELATRSIDRLGTAGHSSSEPPSSRQCKMHSSAHD